MTLSKKTLAAITLGMALMLGSTAVAADRDSWTDVVRDVEIEMAAIAEHAAKLDQWVEMPRQFDTLTQHRYEWTGIQDRFNNVGNLIPKLQKASMNATDWQKEAVNEMTSLIQAMKPQIETGMTYVSETATVERLLADEMYELRIQSVTRYADHIDRLIQYVQTRTSASS